MKKRYELKWRLLPVCLLSFSIGLICPPLLTGEESPKKELQTENSDEYEYVIGPEDILEIAVWKNAGLSKVVTVRPDGKISLPLIGDVHAADATPEELREKIITKLKEYQETVVVSVIVESVNSFKVFILGEVGRPGVYTLKTRTTLIQAIAMAGGFNQFASENKIVLIRSKKGGPEEEKYKIRFDDIVSMSETSYNNIVLRPGDTIFIP